jgi:hypothetical protein
VTDMANGAPSLEADAPDLQERIAATPSDQFRSTMVSLGVPDDIAQRVAALDFGDRGKVQEALLSCYGRLQHLQTAGRFVAELLHRTFQLARQQKRDVRQLDSDGGVVVTPLLTQAQAAAARGFLLKRPVYNGHVPEATQDRIGRYVGHTAEQFPFGSHSLSDIVAAPHLIEAALSDDMIAMAAAHLGCTPILSSLQVWWNFSEHRANPVAEAGASLTDNSPRHYHRDLNDFRMFWVYLYLTDVDDDCGPHQILKGSGSYRNIERRLRSSAAEFNVGQFFYQYGYQIPDGVLDELFPDAVTTFSGAAGATLLSNGFNFHRIRYPLVKPRLMFAARFSLYQAPFTGDTRDGDPIPFSFIADRVATTSTMRHVTQNLFDWR